jgi:hypothetical protein
MAMPEIPTNPVLPPYDPMCERYAKDMTAYDMYIMEGPDDPTPTADQREAYVVYEEGTFNPTNGHFLCDDCYIKAGMPSSPTGWKCP